VHETELATAKHLLLEKYLRGEVTHNLALSGPIMRHRDSGTPRNAPLSLVQESLWHQAQAASDAPSIFNESITIHRNGSLDPKLLERCMVEIIRRHEAWRTTFDSIKSQPFQIIHPPVTHFPIPACDLTFLPESAREAEAERVGRQDARQPFDLKRGPLVRIKLVKLGDQRFRLYLTMHQIVVDGVSVYQVLPTELSNLYEALVSGKDSPLLELPIQSADFAIWDRDRAHATWVDSQAAFWRKQVGSKSGIGTLQQRFASGSAGKFRGAIEPFEFSRELSSALRKLGSESGATLFMVLAAGFAALLHAYTEDESIFVGTLAPAGRKRAEVHKLLGYFLNPIPLKTQPTDQLSFLEFVAQVREVVSEALCHDEVPLETALQDNNGYLKATCESLFENLISLAPSVAPLPEGWKQTPMDVESGSSRWKLYLELSDRTSGILGRAQYNADVFDRASVRNLIQDLQHVLEAATQRPNAQLNALIPSFSCTHFRLQRTNNKQSFIKAAANAGD
jgi:Condensation domain